MPVYRYRALTAYNKVMEGIEFADDTHALIGQLRTRKLTLITTLRERPSILARPVSWGTAATLLTHWQHLLKAGIPLIKAVNLLAHFVHERRLQNAFLALEASLLQGQRFAGGLQLTMRGAFPPEVIALLTASADLQNAPDLLGYVATYCHWRAQTQHKQRNAMRYPLILSLIALSLIWLSFEVVLPALSNFLHQTQAHAIPPFVTKAHALWSHYALGLWYPLTIGVMGLACTIAPLRRALMRHAHYLKPIYTLWLTFELSRFFKLFVCALDVGYTEEKALRVLKSAPGFPLLQPLIKEAHRQVTNGLTLSHAFKACPLLPPFIGEVTALTEQTGRLKEAYTQLALIFEDDLIHKTNTLISWTQPFFLIIIGLIILLLAQMTVVPLYENLANLQF